MTKEVETASRQQEEGLNQINKAVVQLDIVVQQNASSAEEEQRVRRIAIASKRRE